MTDYHREGANEMSTFEDGTQVVADFEKNDLVVGGKRIEKPKDL